MYQTITKNSRPNAPPPQTTQSNVAQPIDTADAPVCFYTSARWARRGIVIPLCVRRRLPLCAPPSVSPSPHTLFWLVHQHGATDYIHNSYKHSTPPCTFFTLCHRSKVKVKDLKKILLTR